jgi:hypothetical protein
MRLETIVPPKEAECISIQQLFSGSAAEDSDIPRIGDRLFRLYSDGMVEEKLLNQDGEAVYVPLELGAKADLHHAITGWVPFLPQLQQRIYR